MQPDLAREQIDRLIEVLLQIDDAVGAEAGYAVAGLRVERDELIPGRDVEDALLLAVAPVGEPATGKLTRRGRTTRTLVLAVHPQLLAGGGIERHDGATRAPGRVEDALHHERRGLEIELGTGSEVVGLEAPGDLERVEVRGGDLIERRVSRVAEIAAVGRPLAVLRAGLAGDHSAQERHDNDDESGALHDAILPAGPKDRPYRPYGRV